MKTDRWQKISALYHAVLARPGDERHAYLQEACAGDEPLQREVEALLAHDAGEALVDTPALAAAAQALAAEPAGPLVGRRLGAYQVTSFLGAGGMGEVYRARDTKLGRDVAVKILPRLFSSDPGRLGRFEREARLLAALNHPHIGAIYGVEDMDGVPALVLELVEGETLAERLSRVARVGSDTRASRSTPRSKGPGLPPTEAFAIAQQLAEALDAAHDRGIVHRDLKPANIKITPEGTVKVLDFGLARLGSDATGAAGWIGEGTPSESPTLASLSATKDGLILGTAAYMSPEQARGQPVDKRTDIWAFGCVLYEMLCGRPAFAGDSLTDTLAAIVDRDPDWTALPEATTATVRTVLTRCLEKDSKRRIRDIGDVQLALSGAFDAPKEMSPASGHAAIRTSRRLSVAAGSLVVAACAAGLLMWLGADPAVPRVSRLSIPSTATAAAVLTNTGRSHRTLTIAPDGSLIVYIGSNSTRLLARALNAVDPVELAAGQELRNPFVSPDGQWVGYTDGSALKKVALTGGAAIVLTNLIGTVLGATWLPDDTIVLATSATTGLQRVPAVGGPASELTRADHDHGQVAHIWPESLPGGNAVLFTIASQTNGQDSAQIAVLDLSSRTQKILVPGGSHAQYVASGHLVYSAAGALWAVPFDLRRLEVRGTPVRVLPRLVTTVNGSAQFAVATDGTLVYADAPGAMVAPRTLVWVDRSGKETPFGAPTRPYLQARLSPDGTRVAVVIADQDQDIWVWDVERATLARVTADPSNDAAPVWTSDGQRLIFASLRDGGVFNLWWQAADGTGTAERLTTSATTQAPTSVSPDGRNVVFFENTLPRQLDLWRGALPGMEVSPLLNTSFSESNGEISPDGRWLAYQSNNSGRLEIYVRPFPNAAASQSAVSTSGGKMAAWSANELFFFEPDGALARIPFDARSARWHAGASTKLFGPLYFAGGDFYLPRTYDVSRDGQKFVMIKAPGGDSTSAPAGLIVVQHWDQELKTLVPAK
jgi:eukaryotic-like serine/threonine-protein kinase